MIVSIAMAVLPMARSPMISSRWPRPIGIIESIALTPVWSGSFTGCRLMMPGATMSTSGLRGMDRPPPVHRTPQGVHHPSYHRGPDRDLQHSAGATHLVPLAQLQVVAEDHRADVVLFEVERLADHLIARLGRRELEHFARHGRGEPVDARDAVLHLEHRADLPDIELGQVGRLDFLEEDL